MKQKIKRLTALVCAVAMMAVLCVTLAPVNTAYGATLNEQLAETRAKKQEIQQQLDQIKSDKAKALENNYTLRINKKKLANSSNNSKKESLQMTIDDNIQRIGSSVDSAYKNVIQSQTAYQQAAVSLEVASKNMEAAERKMQIGTLSRLDYLTQQYAYLQAQVAMEDASMALFQAVESYDWNINGLASASAGM